MPRAPITLLVALLALLPSACVGVDAARDAGEQAAGRNGGAPAADPAIASPPPEQTTPPDTPEITSPESTANGSLEESGSDPSPASGYTIVTDNSGALSVEVPVAWTDVDGAPVEAAGVAAASVGASTDLINWKLGFDEPGAYFAASEGLAGREPDAVLAEYDYSGSCASVSREDYDDGAYVGLADYYSGCGETGGADFVAIAARPMSGDHIVILLIGTPVDAAGEEDRRRVMETFEVTDDVGLV